MITEGYQTNFQTILDAAGDGSLCLVNCLSITTGTDVMTVCACNRYADGSVELVPLAKLFDGDPYDEVMPPTEEKTLAEMYPEGWCLSQYAVDSGAFWAIQRIDEMGRFGSDIEAYAYVREAAERGSAAHMKAIDQHGRQVQ